MPTPRRNGPSGLNSPGGSHGAPLTLKAPDHLKVAPQPSKREGPRGNGKLNQERNPKMPRRLDPDRDLSKDWKISLPATLAGRIEYALMDSITHKPVYGARNRLIAALLDKWLWEQRGDATRPPPSVPSLDELLV